MDYMSQELLMNRYNSLVKLYGKNEATKYLNEIEISNLVEIIIEEFNNKYDEAAYNEDSHYRSMVCEDDLDLLEKLFCLSTTMYRSNFFYIMINFEECRINMLSEDIVGSEILINNLSLGLDIMWTSGKTIKEIACVLYVICSSYFKYLKNRNDDIFLITQDLKWFHAIEELKKDQRFLQIIKFYNDQLEEKAAFEDYNDEEYCEFILTLGVIGHEKYQITLWEHLSAFNDVKFLFNELGTITNNLDLQFYLIFQCHSDTLLSITRQNIDNVVLSKKIRNSKRSVSLRDFNYNDFFDYIFCTLNYKNYCEFDIYYSHKLLNKGIASRNENIISLGLYFLFKFYSNQLEIVESTVIELYFLISNPLKKNITKYITTIDFSDLFIMKIFNNLIMETEANIDLDEIVVDNLKSLYSSCNINLSQLIRIIELNYIKSFEYAINYLPISNKNLLKLLERAIENNLVNITTAKTILSKLICNGELDTWIKTIDLISPIVNQEILEHINICSFSNKNENQLLKSQILSKFRSLEYNIKVILIELLYLNRDLNIFKLTLFENLSRLEEKNDEDIIEQNLNEIEEIFKKIFNKNTNINNLYKEYRIKKNKESIKIISVIDDLTNTIEQLLETINQNELLNIGHVDKKAAEQYHLFYVNIVGYLQNINKIYSNANSKEVMEIRDRFKEIFGNGWDKLTKNSQTFLETGEILKNYYIRKKDLVLDYSPICICFCKAWETELWDKLINKTITYYKNTGIEKGLWPLTLFDVRDKNNLKQEKHFTLNDSERLLNTKDQYFNKFLKIHYDEEFIKVRSNIIKEMIVIRRIRNNAAHKNEFLDVKDYFLCREILFDDKKIFPKLIELIKN